MIRVVVDDEINRALSNIGDRLLDLSDPFADFGEYMLGEIRGYFDDETSPGGSAWAPLSAAWIKTKQRNKKDRGIGKYTFALRDGINYQSDARSLEIGSGERYAEWFNDGTQKMAARPFLELTAENKRELLEILKDSLL